MKATPGPRVTGPQAVDRGRRLSPPRWLLHRGVVRASALLVSGRFIGEPAARRRVLAAWVPGTQVHRHGPDWIVRWPTTRPVRCERAPGLPLLEVGGALMALPGAFETSCPPGALARMMEGRLAVTPVDAAVHDPSEWLDLDGFTRATLRPLAPPPDPAPRVVDLPPVAFDPRAQLAGIPAASEEQRQAVAALLAGSGPAGAHPAPPAARPRFDLRPLLARLRAFVGALRRWAGGQGQTGSAPAPAARAPHESWVQRGLGRLWGALDRLMWKSPLGQVVGRRHAEHLARLFDMFERGDTLEALRHAIPLSGPMAAALRGLNLGTWTPRRALTIHAASRPAASSLGVGPDLFAELQRTYRDAFSRLDAQGRVDEAAFILSELLHADEEAVSYLEKHGRLRLAAEMAEARDLAAGIVVRQWFLAGDRARAIEIAHRRGAFVDAVLRLSRSGHETEASALRLLWGEALAQAGDYAAAVETVWVLPAAWPLAMGWIDRALESGAPAALALLPRKLQARPESFPEVRDAVIDLLEADDAFGVAPRSALAQALVEAPASAGTRVLARAAVRAVLRDAALYASDWPPERLRELVERSGDDALRTDLPSYRPRADVPLARRPQPIVMEISGTRVGTGALADAAHLPGGRTLVARGEAGVLLLSRDGKTLAHFDVPAQALVVSDFGDRAIAVAPRGTRCRLSRLDLLRRTAEFWCEAEIDAFARDYDGRRWFIATRDLLAIDVHAARFEAAWGVSDVVPEGGAVRLARSPERCFLLVLGADAPQVWAYHLPSLVLRERRDVSLAEGTIVVALARDGRLIEHAAGFASTELRPGASTGGPVLYYERPDRVKMDRVLAGSGEAPGPIAAHAAWAAVGLIGRGYVRVVLLDSVQGLSRAEVRLERATAVSLRFSSDALTIADDVGRLLVLDLEHGWLIRDLRL